MLLNEVTFAGNLGRDAEVKNVGQSKVAEFSLAHTEKGRDGRQDTVTWMNVSAWGNWADYAGTFKKGDNVVVRGKLKTDMWEKDGVKRYATSIQAFSLGRIERSERKSSEAPASSFSGSGQQNWNDDNIPF